MGAAKWGGGGGAGLRVEQCAGVGVMSSWGRSDNSYQSYIKPSITNKSYVRRTNRDFVTHCFQSASMTDWLS